MSVDIIDLAERTWQGELKVGEQDVRQSPVWGNAVALSDEVSFLHHRANVTAFRTDDGLVMVDTGSKPMAPDVFAWARAFDTAPLHTAVYTHGHLDHVFGVGLFDEEAAERGLPRPRVVAHEALPARFDRYRATAGWNEQINRRQFSHRGPWSWPLDYRYPDETVGEHGSLDVGGLHVELHHGRGETDDHLWAWVPEHRILCTGDFFIWVFPNAGNPQKVQRYPLEWAHTLRAMAAVEPEILLPGHGLPIMGADRVRTALEDTAEALELVHDETVRLMNEGARLDDIVHAVRLPDRLAAKPYLQPLYDEPEFVVRNVWRLYGGWWDGNPAHLKPAPEAALAAELAGLAGGARKLAERAGELAAAGDLRLACHLAEMAGQAAPEDEEVAGLRAAVFRQRAASEASLMAQGVFRAAAPE